jgi:hypothetical protein
MIGEIDNEASGRRLDVQYSIRGDGRIPDEPDGAALHQSRKEF